MTASNGSRSLHWGIIGCGDVAEKKSGPALYTTPNSQLAAVMRRDAAQAEAYARRHAVPRWYSDVASLLADPDVNAVYIASPHDCHLQHVRQTVAAGKKVILCEKPLGTGTAQAQACVDACRERGVSLTVAYYRRFWPVVQALHSLLAEGAIGHVIGARVLLLDHFAGDPARPWLTSKAASGGGALANAGSHWVDLLRYLLGEIVEVSAVIRPSALGFDVEDSADIRLLTAQGAVATLLSSWRPAISVNELEVIGTEGRMVAAPLSEGRLLLQRRGQELEERRYPRSGPAHSELLAALVPSVLVGSTARSPAGDPASGRRPAVPGQAPLLAPAGASGRRPAVPGEEGVAVWRIMEAAYRSSAEGRRVRLP